MTDRLVVKIEKKTGTLRRALFTVNNSSSDIFNKSAQL